MLEATRIDPDSLENLTDEELRELVAQLEELHLEKRRNSLEFFAENMEIPGTPAPLTAEERRQVALRERGEDVPFEEDNDVAEFYPKKLELAAHHRLMLKSIQDMVEGVKITGPCGVSREIITTEIDGIMFMLPPGSAKSTFGSVVAPAFCLGHWKNFDVIAASYAAELSKRFGRRVRHVVRDPEFVRTFQTGITGDNQAVDQWSLENGSGYRAVGVLGGVTGFRANLLIIDDPIAGREEADSEIIREKIWKAIEDDLFTRLKPNGKVVLIMTRWHQDDPAGRILGEEWKGQSGLWRGNDGRMWYIINLPMEAEHADDPLGRKPGERLWSQWFTEKHVNIFKGKGGRTWSALFQQRPAASEGLILLREYWRCWPHGKPLPTEEQLRNPASVKPPDVQQIILSYDTAFEEGEENDYSAMTAWGIFETESIAVQRKNAQVKQNHAIMLGAWRDKVKAAELMDYAEEHFRHWRPDLILVEKRASGIQLAQEMRMRRWPVHDYLPSGRPGAKGKVPRAHTASYIMEQGTIWYMPGPKTLAVIDECAMFPSGTNDDWVDTVTAFIDWARLQLTTLQIPSDELSDDEQAEIEAEQFWMDASGRQLYASSGRRFDVTRRRLYG